MAFPSCSVHPVSRRDIGYRMEAVIKLSTVGLRVPDCPSIARLCVVLLAKCTPRGRLG